MHGNAFTIITVGGQAQQIFLAEARDVETARAPDALIQIRRIRGVPIFRHVRVALVFADDNQTRAVGRHGFQNVRPPRQHVGHDVIVALQRRIGNFG